MNVFHIGSYGKKTEDIWDEVLTELEKRYDLSETVIYLHGDGANWIRSGLEILPNAVFVLDPYHKSKYLRQSVRDMGEKSAKNTRNCCSPLYGTEIRSVSPLFLQRFSKPARKK